MYLSLLKLNPRSRRAMGESSRPYELHRSIMRAFPSGENGSPGRVLFRQDTDRETGAMSILVQSEKEPNWTTLNGSAGLFSEPPQYKVFDPRVAVSHVLYFRLRANPTGKRDGKRLGILGEEPQIEWLVRKGEEGGFELVSVTVVPEGIARDKTTDAAGLPHDLSLLSVRFEGFLRVTNPVIFRQTLQHGIGSGKGLGFGLLSIAPLREV